eukprot:scaffold1767_cov131-Skeletonema_menzelii.AAC.3
MLVITVTGAIVDRYTIEASSCSVRTKERRFRLRKWRHKLALTDNFGIVLYRWTRSATEHGQDGCRNSAPAKI